MSRSSPPVASIGGLLGSGSGGSLSIRPNSVALSAPGWLQFCGRVSGLGRVRQRHQRDRVVVKVDLPLRTAGGRLDGIELAEDRRHLQNRRSGGEVEDVDLVVGVV